MVKVTKLTDIALMRLAASFTNDPAKPLPKLTLEDIYRCEHSPMRTQLFWVEMDNVPTFVAVHLRTHHVGVTHFIQSRRGQDAGRYTPVRHAMLINAQELINMARQRLCFKAAKETIAQMARIKHAVAKVDPDLAKYMVPNCQYRHFCPELRPCKYKKQLLETAYV